MSELLGQAGANNRKQKIILKILIKKYCHPKPGNTHFDFDSGKVKEMFHLHF